jgi:hypothetical protein
MTQQQVNAMIREAVAREHRRLAIAKAYMQLLEEGRERHDRALREAVGRERVRQDREDRAAAYWAMRDWLKNGSTPLVDLRKDLGV